MAAWAFTGDIAVGKEGLRFFVVILLRSLFNELSFVIQFAEEVGSCLVMYFRTGASVGVERDSEFLERITDKRMVTVDYILRGDAFFFGTDGNRNTMLIRSSDEKVLPLSSGVSSARRYQPARKRQPSDRCEPDRWHKAVRR